MSCNTNVVIADWMGADKIYPKELVFSSTDEFWNLVRQPTKVDLRQYVIDNFSMDVVLPKIESIFNQIMKEKPHE